MGGLQEASWFGGHIILLLIPLAARKVQGATLGRGQGGLEGQHLPPPRPLRQCRGCEETQETRVLLMDPEEMEMTCLPLKKELGVDLNIHSHPNAYFCI